MIIWGKFGIDKIYYFYGGLSFSLLTLFVVLLVQLLGGSVSPAIGAVSITLAALVAGILKDLYDALIQKEDFDLADVTFTWLGSIPILLIWFEIVYLFLR